jgi:hypothetical protein
MTYQYPPTTIDMLREHCNQKYAVFTSYLHLGINDEYRKFKSDLKDDMSYMFETLDKSTNDKLTLALLHHFNNQLTFMYENESVCHPTQMEEFKSINYPYKEKVDAIVSKYSLIQQDEAKPNKKNKLK